MLYLRKSFATLLLSGLLFIPPVATLAATVSFTSGPTANPVLFETTTESLLDGGHLFAGTFTTPPSVGVSYSDVVANYENFGALSTNPSTNLGFFNNGAFTGTLDNSPGGFDFTNEQIYILVLNTDSAATATEFALFTSDTWTFQSSDIDPTVPLVDLPAIDTPSELLAGSFSTTTIGASNFSSIQLQSTIPEPSSWFLALIGFIFACRRQRKRA